MIPIAKVEEAVVRRLRAALPLKTVQIETFPANARTFIDTFRAASGALLVQYVGRKRTHTADYAGTDVLTLEITAISRNLRGDHSAIYTLLDAARLAVSGINLTETVSTGNAENPTQERLIGARFYLQDEEYEAYLEKNGLWIYKQTYLSDPIGWIQDDNADIVITEITVKSPSGIEEIIP
jgi:hypothetical protein